jgi:chemotaxis protein MotB
MFFESGRPAPTPSGAALLTRLAEELGELPNTILIEGHTDAKPFGGDRAYTNWELSTDRANAARRLMETHGIRAEQVGQVRGYGDRQLRHPEEPQAASNRRISVIVQYVAGSPKGETPEQGRAVGKPEEKKAEHH